MFLTSRWLFIVIAATASVNATTLAHREGWMKQTTVGIVLANLRSHELVPASMKQASSLLEAVFDLGQTYLEGYTAQHGDLEHAHTQKQKTRLTMYADKETSLRLQTTCLRLYRGQSSTACGRKLTIS
jgi:hypothetical protein